MTCFCDILRRELPAYNDMPDQHFFMNTSVRGYYFNYILIELSIFSSIHDTLNYILYQQLKNFIPRFSHLSNVL
jgi:hypothetical protein